MLICSALHTLCLLCLKMLHLCLFKPEHCSFQVMLFHMLFMPKYAERKASRMDKSLTGSEAYGMYLPLQLQPVNMQICMSDSAVHTRTYSCTIYQQYIHSSRPMDTTVWYVCMVITYNKSMDQPGKVANPARGQLNRENEYFPVRVRA